MTNKITKLLTHHTRLPPVILLLCLHSRKLKIISQNNKLNQTKTLAPIPNSMKYNVIKSICFYFVQNQKLLSGRASSQLGLLLTNNAYLFFYSKHTRDEP